MEDIIQTYYFSQIRDFAAGDAIKALDRVQLHKSSVWRQIDTYQQETLSISAAQYDILAEIAMVCQHRRS